MSVSKAVRRHAGPIVIVTSAAFSLIVAAIAPVDRAGVLDDSSVVILLGSLLVGALVASAVIRSPIQALEEQIACAPDCARDAWKAIKRVIGHIEKEVKQDVCYVLAMIACVFTVSCVIPALPELDYLFAAFKMFSVITSVAAIHDVIGSVPALDAALTVVRTYNEDCKDDRMNEV